MPYKDPIKQKEYVREYGKKHYEENKLKRDEQVRRAQLLRRMKKKKWIVKQLGEECAGCGYKKCLAALDIHHIDPNKKENKKPLYYFGWKYIKSFIEKEKEFLSLLCSNCHRELHWELYKRGKELLAKANEELLK